MFRTPYIKDTNYQKYDYALSISKHFTNFASWGNIQSRIYDPGNVSCYTTYDKRVIYSLQQQFELTKDNWRQFLANNYHDFDSQVVSMRPVGRTGAIIMLNNNSPILFQGVETLDLNGGTKLSIGDGQLFNAQPLQNLVNADPEFEYGSCQNRFSVINTPAGLFYMSQNQGKVFSYGQGLQDVSKSGMKWWFSQYSPYALLEDFPNIESNILDNTIIGVGCQTTYDNINEIVFFCKRDFKLKPAFKGKVTYLFSNKFGHVDFPGYQFDLGDPMYFDDASWTVSYDPKTRYWVSFHDWHPDLTIPTSGSFVSTKLNSLYTHNANCNDYCNFYGVQHPFEIEFPFNTGQTVTTLRSIEYLLECYRRDQNYCVDQFNVLDYNFDQAVIFNNEQVSGYLNLNIFPKNNVVLSQQYPKLNTSNLASFDILFSKEEHKYRINQFWDITKDRGEFPINSDYPPTGPVVPGTTVLQGNYAQENLWITQANGYIKTLNPVNLDYNKPQLQRKKFRNYLNSLKLTKNNSRDTNMIVKIINTKHQISPR